MCRLLQYLANRTWMIQFLLRWMPFPTWDGGWDRRRQSLMIQWTRVVLIQTLMNTHLRARSGVDTNHFPLTITDHRLMTKYNHRGPSILDFIRRTKTSTLYWKRALEMTVMALLVKTRTRPRYVLIWAKVMPPNSAHTPHIDKKLI